jgi:hypothetical protein
MKSMEYMGFRPGEPLQVIEFLFHCCCYLIVLSSLQRT